MQLWEALKKSALLGLARHPLSEEVLRELDELGVNVAQEPADVLLEAAAVVSRMQRAAMVLEKHPGELPAPADLEDGEALEAPVVRLLQPAFEGDYKAALPEILALMRTHGKQLPGEMLPALFERLREQPDQLEALRPLWGARGEWWLCRHPIYRRFARVPPPESWPDGGPAARQRFLRYLRRYNPDEGRDLLAASWDKLPKEEKIKLLHALRTQLNAADLPFLRSLATERTVVVRRAAAALRLAAGEADITARFTERFKTALQSSGSADGPVVQYIVPDTPDEEAYADGLLVRRSPGKKWSADYLDALLAGVPTATWADLLGLPPADLTEALLRSDRRDTLLPAYLRGLLAAVDVEGMTAVWKTTLTTADATLVKHANAIAALSAALPAATVDGLLLAFARKESQLIRDEVFWKLLLNSPHAWSNNLTLALLKPFQRFLRTDQFRLPPLPAYRQLLKVGGYRVAPAMLSTIEQQWYTFGPAYGQWEQDIDAFHRVLLFRKRGREALGAS